MEDNPLHVTSTVDVGEDQDFGAGSEENRESENGTWDSSARRLGASQLDERRAVAEAPASSPKSECQQQSS